MSDDPVDIKTDLEVACLQGKCKPYIQDYHQCTERIKSVPPEKEAHCWQWYHQVVHCVDACAHKDLWASIVKGQYKPNEA